MTKPALFEDAWTEAEQRAFQYITEATQTVENKSAFLGSNPGILNAWHLEHAAMDEGVESVLLSGDQPSIAMPYQATGAFTKRDACQKWFMRMLAAMPLRTDKDSNVALLRIRHHGAIEESEVDVANNKQSVRVWSLTLGLDLVFATGGKANGKI